MTDMTIRPSFTVSLTSVVMVKLVRFSENVSVYLVPNFCDSRFGSVWRRKHDDEQCTENHRDGITPTGEKEFSQTCGGVEGIARPVPSGFGGNDTAREVEQRIQVSDDRDKRV